MDSWVEAGFGRCFQLMECDDALLLQQWVLHWRGTGVTFEIVPVVPGRQVSPWNTALAGGGPEGSAAG